MTLACVDILGTFSHNVMCEKVIVGYEDRRLYVPPSCAATTLGHVIEVEYCERELELPLEVHQEYQQVVDMFGDDVTEYLANEDDSEYKRMHSSRFFMLKDGLGIRIESMKPVFAKLEQAGRAFTMSLFRTREGIVLHKLHVIGETKSTEALLTEELITRIMQTSFPDANAEDVQDIALVPVASTKETTTYVLHLPRVIRLQ